MSEQCIVLPPYNNYTYITSDGKYYQNGKYSGDVIYSDDKIFEVELKNGEKQIISRPLPPANNG